jgi:hypothetical protein
MAGQGAAGGMEPFHGVGLQSLKHEKRARRVICDPGSLALAPVPAAACHTGVVAPDNLALLGVVNQRNTGLCGRPVWAGPVR